MQQIQWFPGHMAKARREINESLKKVDAVLELVDARLPYSSANPLLRELVGNKPRVVVMTRADLADPKMTKEWEAHFQRLGHAVVTVDTRQGMGINRILPALEEAAVAKRRKDEQRGIRKRALRTMVVGIPNVGKSSLINRLANKAATKTGDRPGITKTQQWIRLGNIELLDTPGVLWPKFEERHSGFALAISGAIKSDILDLMEVCSYFTVWLDTHYPGLLFERYDLGSEVSRHSGEFTMQSETTMSDWEIAEPTLAAIALRRGLLRPGGLPDVERAAELVLREAQTGKLGRITLEWVNETVSTTPM